METTTYMPMQNTFKQPFIENECADAVRGDEPLQLVLETFDEDTNQHLQDFEEFRHDASNEVEHGPELRPASNGRITEADRREWEEELQAREEALCREWE